MKKITGKPNVDEFLDAGKATEKAEERQAPAQKAIKRKKLVELPEEVFVALKDRAHEDFKKTGKTVTETEIIITALKKHLRLV